MRCHRGSFITDVIVVFVVMLPVYLKTKDALQAWSAGLAWAFMIGVIVMIGAFVGPYIRKLTPRAAMLGTLAGISITFIAAHGDPYTEIKRIANETHADAIVVGVLKRAGINLIEDGALPPRSTILLPCPVRCDDLNHERLGFTFGTVAAFALGCVIRGGGVGLPP